MRCGAVCTKIFHIMEFTKKKMWFLALVAAMGGFLFGYDTVVINGAEQQIQQVFNLSPALHGWVISSALWGTVIGALFGGKITDRYGRKPTLCAIGLLYLISAVWSALATGAATLVAARFLGGLAVGCSSTAAPVYIAEISPAKSRGLMTAIFQFDVVLGVLASQFVNLAIGTADGAWRWMLGAEAVPALLFVILCPFLVESPRWLAEKAAGRTGKITVKDDAPKFWCRANLKPILLAFAVAFFNQLSGINAVNYFMKRIYMMAGFTDQAALSLVAMTGVINAISTMLGMWLIDRVGRRTLLIAGGTGYVLSLFACAIAFATGHGTIAAICVILFIFSHAFGQGTVIWVLVAEVFPTAIRAQGQSLGAFTHWFCSAMITLIFPIAAAKCTPSSIFFFFGAFMVAHLLWAIFIVPETKGKKLEDIKL